MSKIDAVGFYDEWIVLKEDISLIMQIEGSNNAHSVTMSALAASTAIVRGVLSSMSAAFWFAPLFRNKHTCLKEEEKGNTSSFKHAALQPSRSSDCR